MYHHFLVHQKSRKHIIRLVQRFCMKELMEVLTFFKTLLPTKLAEMVCDEWYHQPTFEKRFKRWLEKRAVKVIDGVSGKTHLFLPTVEDDYPFNNLMYCERTKSCQILTKGSGNIIQTLFDGTFLPQKQCCVLCSQYSEGVAKDILATKPVAKLRKLSVQKLELERSRIEYRKYKRHFDERGRLRYFHFDCCDEGNQKDHLNMLMDKNYERELAESEQKFNQVVAEMEKIVRSLEFPLKDLSELYEINI